MKTLIPIVLRDEDAVAASPNSGRGSQSGRKFLDQENLAAGLNFGTLVYENVFGTCSKIMPSAQGRKGEN